jgi:long-chain acyl-CoA synthetase
VERYPEWPNLAAMMFSQARQWPTRPMLRAFRHDAWVSLNWGDFARQAASVARRLRLAGVSAGDRVLIVSENRPEFPIMETALLAIRAVPVPAYTTYTTADFAHVLKDCGARVAVVSTAELARKVIPAGKLDLLISLDDFTEGGVVTASFARWPGLPDLHLRHRRRPARGDAAAQGDFVELRRRLPAAANDRFAG